MLIGTGPRGGNPDSDPAVPERAPRPVLTVDDFLIWFIGRSQTGPALWERRHRRVNRDPPR